MEEGFDLSKLIWVLFIGAAIFYNFFAKKPKVDMHDPEQVEEFDECEGFEEFEQRERDFESQQQITQLPRQPRPSPRGEVKGKTPGSKVAAKERRNPVETEASEEEDLVEEFDLRKAVIMSEILNRKYEE
ncbi:MAG: hypothetical protein SNH94_03875 [Rikenellaceae bacterium]